MAKPTIDQLLIDSALQPDLCRRLLESPDQVFADFDLTQEQQAILRRPDHRLIPLLGAALARQMQASAAAEAAPTPSEPAVKAEAPGAAGAFDRPLPDTLMALTVVPCALREGGQLKGITYVMWVSPLPEGADPASLPAPQGTVLPGEPLTPLHAVIRISALQARNAAGDLRVGMWGSFRQAPDLTQPPPPEAAALVTASPFLSPLGSPAVQAAVAAVRQAADGERYSRLVDLLHSLHQGDVR